MTDTLETSISEPFAEAIRAQENACARLAVMAVGHDEPALRRGEWITEEDKEALRAEMRAYQIKAPI